MFPKNFPLFLKMDELFAHFEKKKWKVLGNMQSFLTIFPSAGKLYESVVADKVIAHKLKLGISNFGFDFTKYSTIYT